RVASPTPTGPISRPSAMRPRSPAVKPPNRSVPVNSRRKIDLTGGDQRRTKIPIQFDWNSLSGELATPLQLLRAMIAPCLDRLAPACYWWDGDLVRGSSCSDHVGGWRLPRS